VPKLCPECKAVLGYKARECSACGAQIIAVSQVREAQGELVELGARRSGEKAPDIAEKAAFYGELLWIVRNRGYSSGWAAHEYREKFGVWPNDPRIRCATASRPSPKDEKLDRFSADRLHQGKAHLWIAQTSNSSPLTRSRTLQQSSAIPLPGRSAAIAPGRLPASRKSTYPAHSLRV
jgi:hypothetical protein